MPGLKHCRIAVALVLMAAGLSVVITVVPRLPPTGPAWAQVSNSPDPSRYETRAVHDPNGTGRFYMGREIAQVMGIGGVEWLDRPDRDSVEHPSMVIDALNLRGNEVVADLGAGSGYYTFRIASRLGESGKVLAVDIQEAMLEIIRTRAEKLRITNVEEIKADADDPHLPAGGVDGVLMVDVYHELAYPYEIMTHVRAALKPGGRVVFVEYRKEDPGVPIKEVHKMSVKQLKKEMDAVGLTHLQTIESLPWQHIVIFAAPQS